MSDTKNDGGPAFPLNDNTTNECTGMSLRDWFATAALIIVGSQTSGVVKTAEKNKQGIADTIAAAAYEIADAMLAERTKDPA